MLILEDGTLIDTIGGGCAESDVITKALLMMREEKSAVSDLYGGYDKGSCRRGRDGLRWTD